tara:strand:+ start:214 stop:837 length:624 start_codon:yes stop_codon:yes gene_type:complete
MPNWCDNQITITGPNSVIDKIEKIVKEEKDGDGLLNFMSPMPKELDGTTAPSPADKPQPMIEGFDNWYDWRCENWSTKWDVNEFYGVDRQGDTISFGFSSAWSPPINAYQTFLMNMSEKNLDVSVKAYYYEGGCDFMGCWDNGDDDCYSPGDYKSTDDFWSDGIGYELDEMFNITESMAEYEAELEAEKEDVHEYVKGKAMNIGEEA